MLARIKPSWGMLFHAMIGFGLAFLAMQLMESFSLSLVCTFITAFGISREIGQAGSLGNLTLHKIIEGLSWSACWLILLLK